VLEDLGDAATIAVASLIHSLVDPLASPGTRAAMARALGAIGAPVGEVVPALIQCVQDHAAWVRLWAIRALGEIGTPAHEAVPSLVEALADVDGNVRRNAAFALAQMGVLAQEAVPALIQALAAEEVGGVAAEALAKIGRPALPALLQTLLAEDEHVCRRAAYALGKLGTPEADCAVRAWERDRAIKPLLPSAADFYLAAPNVQIDSAKAQEFEQLFQAALTRGIGSIVDYTSIYPKYEFLCYLVEHKQIVLHGSNRMDIEILQPVRWSTDAIEAGNVAAVYAIPDGIYPLHFATVDKTGSPGLNNGSFWATDGDGVRRKFYEFAINAEMLRKQPWTSGMVYILPRTTFEDVGAGWVSREPVQPLARLPVAPADFPFMNEIRGYDTRHNIPIALKGFPFLDDVQKYPLRPLHEGPARPNA
jgi:hypothetical protein